MTSRRLWIYHHTAGMESQGAGLASPLCPSGLADEGYAVTIYEPVVLTYCVSHGIAFFSQGGTMGRSISVILFCCVFAMPLLGQSVLNRWVDVPGMKPFDLAVVRSETLASGQIRFYVASLMGSGIKTGSNVVQFGVASSAKVDVASLKDHPITHLQVSEVVLDRADVFTKHQIQPDPTYLKEKDTVFYREFGFSDTVAMPLNVDFVSPPFDGADTEVLQVSGNIVRDITGNILFDGNDEVVGILHKCWPDLSRCQGMTGAAILLALNETLNVAAPGSTLRQVSPPAGAAGPVPSKPTPSKPAKGVKTRSELE